MTIDGAHVSSVFEAALGRAPLGVYLLDSDLRVLWLNRVAREVFDQMPKPASFAGGDVVGRSFEEFVRAARDEAYVEKVLAIFRRTIATGEPFVTAERGDDRVKDGLSPYYEWRLERADIPGGGHGIVCYFRDVSDRDLAEQNAQRLASIVESSDDAIVSKDLDGVIVSWNEGARRVFGYGPEEAIGRHISILIPSDRLDEEPGIIARIRRGERVDHYETVRKRKDGALIDISLTVSPVRDASGRVIGASKIARDISPRKRAEATQKLLLNELNHRVKNTLATVQAIAQQTLRRTPDPADFADRFSGRLQSLSRAHSMLTDATWEGADLSELIRDQLVRGAADEARLKAWGPAVRLPPQMTLHLALMLHELGVNSVKYGALSTASGRVSISWAIDGGMLSLRWAERGGPAVAPPASQGFGGVLIEQSARSSGGHARAIWDVEGVSWEISLPIPQAETAGAGRSRPQTALGGATAGERVRPLLEGLRLLVVEDEPLIALDHASRLEAAGAAETHMAGTVGEALEAIEQGRFDAVLLDANLHGRPVDLVAEALISRAIPFVFVTGYGRDGLPAAHRDQPILPKPFSDEQFNTQLAKLAAEGRRMHQG